MNVKVVCLQSSFFNTFLILACGFLVMFMAAGFAMLESGMVTSKSVSVICAKNIGLFSIAAIMFWLVGYNLAYGIPEGGYIGKFVPWSDASKIGTGYADGSDWYFQMVFCATTVSIVSGTLAERIKLWPFFLFAAILSGIIYPIVMGWQWGGGWLASAGFSDFAGSTLVHGCGGAAALAGVIVLGAREGRFGKRGEKNIKGTLFSGTHHRSDGQKRVQMLSEKKNGMASMLSHDVLCTIKGGTGTFTVIKSFLGKCLRLPAIDVRFFPGMVPSGSTLPRTSALQPL